MSEKMYPIPFKSLMNWVVEEYAASGEIFGVRKAYHATGKSLPIFGERIETPFGPAAGPNSQLAQNIIAAYMAGARFFEVKTVQKMDGADLAACVPRPCILANDEGYNQEWSTELTVPQAMDEYIKAWCALKVLSKVYDLGDPDGFVFNMSVGYDLEGIKGEKVNTYIKRSKPDAADKDNLWNRYSDKENYQTIYAKYEGAVAAPTAGLHFTDRVFDALEKKGVKKVFLTLHVGAGTFLPVKVEDTDDHKMHAEYGIIHQDACDVVNRAKAAGKKIIAVGTTSLRLLETAGDDNGVLHPFTGETDIFITPGYKFKIIDNIVTNFHLPKSTLFMLICAIAGTS